MSPELIDAVRRRALDPTRRTDNCEFYIPEIGAALTDVQLAESRARLGFAPPADLVALYRSVGNGGYGPEYGLLGLEGGDTDEDGQTAVDLYLSFRETDPDHPGWAWPEGLLPIADLGCAMRVCLDCSDGSGRLLLFEPNVLDERHLTKDALFPMAETLSDWLAIWAAGEKTWRTVEAALAARGDQPQ